MTNPEKLSNKKKNPYQRFYERWEKAESGINSLSIRIFAVNIFALFLLAFGVFYLTQYRESLIRTELSSLTSETILLSTTLSKTDLNDKNELTEIFSIFKMATKNEVKLFNPEGTLVFQTKEQKKQKKEQEQTKNFPKTIDVLFKEIVDLIPVHYELPSYPPQKYNNIKDHPDALFAAQGENHIHVWKKENGKGIILTAATPISEKGKIKGILLLIKDDTELENAVTNSRSDILRLFLAAALFTMILSFYLANFIANPLKKLAIGAEAVRLGKSDEEIPDLSTRKDEIGALSVALRAMTKALIERMDSIKSFAADVAHEVKNPLTSLRSAIETAQKVKDEKKIKTLLGIMSHDIERIDRLITDISKSSRLDAELPKDPLNHINLAPFFSQLLSTYRKGTNNNIVLNINEDVPYIAIGNEDRLAQVFQNLIDNALSFSPSDADITITVKKENKKIAVYIEDEGPGIPESKIKNIFDRFYTERPNTESFGQHSGLGLSITRQIVTSHGGSITAENIKDPDGNIEGARFIVILKESE